MRNITTRSRFYKLRKQFSLNYRELKKLGQEPFVLPFWEGVNKKVLQSFEPMPQWDFLSNQAIRDTMFVDGDARWLEIQTEYLKNKVRGKFKNITREDALGAPRLIPGSKTSHNTIHHLYHIYYYLESTKVSLDKINTIVEWGGGYGNFAKLWKRSIKPESTYIIIDTAMFCSVQALYLGCLFGKSQVNLLKDRNAIIEKGKINLVPLALLDSLEIKGDLFVSTWGLSESLDEAQDYVINKKWFSCKHILIGFQNSTTDLKYASRLGSIAAKDGAKIIDIEFIPNNHYAFK